MGRIRQTDEVVVVDGHYKGIKGVVITDGNIYCPQGTILVGWYEQNNFLFWKVREYKCEFIPENYLKKVR